MLQVVVYQMQCLEFCLVLINQHMKLYTLLMLPIVCLKMVYMIDFLSGTVNSVFDFCRSILRCVDFQF